VSLNKQMAICAGYTPST